MWLKLASKLVKIFKHPSDLNWQHRRALKQNISFAFNGKSIL